MSVAHTDQDTVLPKHAAALVWNPEAADSDPNMLSILIPEYDPEQQVPPMITLLAAVLVRSKDEAWVKEMTDWFEAREVGSAANEP